MRRRWALTLFSLLLMLPAAVAAQQDPGSELADVQRELGELSRQIKASRQQASRLAGEISAAEAEMTAAIEVLVVAQAAAEQARAEVDNTRAGLEILETQLADTERALATTRLDLARTVDRLEQEAVARYMHTSASTGLRIFITSTVTERAAAVAYADDLFHRDETVSNTLELLRREEDRQRQVLEQGRIETRAELAKLEAEQTRLEEKLGEAEAARWEAEAKVANARTLLARVQRDIKASEQHKDGLEADAARLQKEIAKRQSQQGERPGQLGWPVNGRLSSPYGYRIHPILGSRRLHTGIDIDVASGTGVGAAEAGVVILAETYGGYGQAVVIDHGGGLSTLYAHQSKLLVSRGDVVTRGQVVGNVGCTGFCTGPHLHFETRENGAPVDPMKYLRG